MRPQCANHSVVITVASVMPLYHTKLGACFTTGVLHHHHMGILHPSEESGWYHQRLRTLCSIQKDLDELNATVSLVAIAGKEQQSAAHTCPLLHTCSKKLAQTQYCVIAPFEADAPVHKPARPSSGDPVVSTAMAEHVFARSANPPIGRVVEASLRELEVMAVACEGVSTAASGGLVTHRVGVVHLVGPR